MNYICKNPKCPSKGKLQNRIGVVSECTQTLNLVTDEYTTLDVVDSLYGYCLECSARIPAKVLTKLIDSAGR
jgi:hypothetical protein